VTRDDETTFDADARESRAEESRTLSARDPGWHVHLHRRSGASLVCWCGDQITEDEAAP
jgi:hypothetical protein